MTQRRLRIQNEVNDRQGELQSVSNINRLIQLERLNKLQNLQNLQNLNNLQELQISNLSYEQVNINTSVSETIIYLDPPYEDTAKYTKGICHKEFYKWVDVLTEDGYIVYISSYKSHLPCVLEIKHTCSLSATATNEVIEKLFTNKDDRIENKELSAVQGSLF